MLTLIDIIDEEIDELIELEEDLAEDGLTLEDFYEWVDQLDEKEGQAAWIGRMKKLGRMSKRVNKLSSTKRKKARGLLKRKTAGKIQKAALRQAQGDVIPKAVMQAKGTGGMIKRKRWKEMKKKMVDRKKVAKARVVKRNEPARMKAARSAFARHGR